MPHPLRHVSAAPDQGGLGGGAIYIDTEGTFRPERLVQIAEAKGLDANEILQKVDHVPDTLTELVVAGAEGNPFFVEEVVKMLVEDGVIVKGEEQWQVEPSRLTNVRVPSTLRGVLQARLDRLPALHRTILQQASVMGRLFWDLAVVRISESAAEGVEEAEVLSTLSALRGAEMVFQRETSAFARAQEYTFKHAVLREVTYESLLESLRSMYHGLVAD